MAAPLASHHSFSPPTLSTNNHHAAAHNHTTKNQNTVVPTQPPSSSSSCLELLEKCANMSELKQIHAHMIRTGLFSDPFTAAGLVSFAALDPLGSLPYARRVFSVIPNPTTFTCNSIIRGYANRSMTKEAVEFYVYMIVAGLPPDRFTFPSVLKSCADSSEGMQTHCQAVKMGFGSDEYVQNTLMKMYAVCGRLVSARKVFDKMLKRNVVSWATVIGAYAQGGDSSEAVELFKRMVVEEVEPNEVALINVLTACARARDLETAKLVHQYVNERGFGFHLVLSAALMDVYCKCGCFRLARDVFDSIPEKEKNLYCWNIMINGHVEGSDYEEALMLFREMQLRGVRGDEVTMVSLLLACTHLGALDLGKWLHAYIKKEKIRVDCALGTALVDMYAKCGSVDTALTVFGELQEKDVMTWTVLITGLAMSGKGETALKIFQEMEETSQVRPDAITFVGVLAACSHAGLVDEGLAQFESMSAKYGLMPTIEHYGCVVDLLGRAGRIAKAEELINSMPMPPDYFVLGGLLGACRIHGEIETAERTAKRLLELDPDNAGTYVLLSNVYSSMGKWEEAKRIRRLMVERNIKKPPGCSSIEIDGAVHEFVKGDKSHPGSLHIYMMLDDMINRCKKAGYIPNKSDVLFDMDEEEKENELSLHSEKLAIAFGLISTSPGKTIRVVKNLRVCSDCHSAIKFISKIYGREILLRDRIRFHLFIDGSCSCRDFW